MADTPMHHSHFYVPPSLPQLAFGMLLAVGISVSVWPNVFYRVSRWNAEGLKRVPKHVRWLAGIVGLVPIGVSIWHIFSVGELRISTDFLQIGIGLTFVLGGVARALQDHRLVAAAALESYFGFAFITLATESLYLEALPEQAFSATMQILGVIGGILALWWVVMFCIEASQKPETGAIVTPTRVDDAPPA